LAFVAARGPPGPHAMGAEASHRAGDYQDPVLPPGKLEVRISVYKLELTGFGLLDHIGAGLAGAYHTGLVVAGEEWAYGFHDVPGKSGVYCSKPEMNPDYIFYQRVILGQVQSTPAEISQKIRKIAFTDKWAGVAYDLIERNCNHFVSDLCWQLLGKRPPSWINGTAEGIALKRRRMRCQETVLAGALSAYCAEHASPSAPAPPPQNAKRNSGEPEAPSPPGAKAFKDAFTSTFEMRWSRGEKAVRTAGEHCPEGEDPQVARRRAEQALLVAAGSAASSAARVVAAAARMAADARRVQPAAGLEAWDAQWVRESSSLLKAWREQACSDTLDADPESAQGVERTAQVCAALAAAGDAALREAERDFPFR